MASKRNKNRSTPVAQEKPAPPAPLLPLSQAHTSSNIAGFLAWAFTALILVGYIGFRVQDTRFRAMAYGNEMSVDKAMFTVVNAATLTGFQLPLAIEHYNPPGQWTILLLTIGGTQFALIAGGCAVSRIAKLPYSDIQIAGVSLGAQLTVLLIGLLFLRAPDQPLVAGLIQSGSAFGNSGVWMGPTPDLLDARTHVLFLPLAILGGLGIPVLMDLFDAARGKRTLSNHTLAVLKLSALVYLVAVAVLFVFRSPANLPAARAALASSSEAAINTRSAGLPIEVAADFPRFIQWFLIALMLIGPAPGGAGGGLKVTTIGRLFAGLRDLVAGRNPGRIFGIAILWALWLILIILLTFLFLLWTEPGQEADRLFFIATSAATNCGLAHDRVGIVGAGMYVLTLAMLLGRILPVCVLWWVASHTGETDVAIG